MNTVLLYLSKLHQWMVLAKGEVLLLIAIPDCMDYCSPAPPSQLVQWPPLPMDMSLLDSQPVYHSSVKPACLL